MEPLGIIRSIRFSFSVFRRLSARAFDQMIPKPRVRSSDTNPSPINYNAPFGFTRVCRNLRFVVGNIRNRYFASTNVRQIPPAAFTNSPLTAVTNSIRPRTDGTRTKYNYRITLNRDIIRNALVFRGFSLSTINLDVTSK